MENSKLEFLAVYAAFRLGCERALDLLTNPDASEFDAEKVIRFLQIVLGEKQNENV